MRYVGLSFDEDTLYVCLCELQDGDVTLMKMDTLHFESTGHERLMELGRVIKHTFCTELAEYYDVEHILIGEMSKSKEEVVRATLEYYRGDEDEA